MFKLRLVITVALLALGIATSTLAHDLLPQNVVDYMATHPNAAPEELERFIQKQAPTLAQRIGSQDQLFRILNRDTSFLDNMLDFVELGVEHILSGLDHILFVLSLLLVFTSLKEILQFTSTFTVAHTVTLLLAGTGILVLPARIVEPLIAFSISYVALTNVFFQGTFGRGHRWDKLSPIFLFGLFHGLGFAGLLQEIHVPSDRFISSLLSFNIGIELGQLIIVAAALPIIYYFGSRPWYGTAVKIMATIIAGLGVWWGVTRII